jgi:ABC-2 type transport system permease protein
LHRVDWSSLTNLLFAGGLLAYALAKIGTPPSPTAMLLYATYLICGIGIFYSLMIALAATSIWLGRNQTLYDFWFYITNFSRYPMEIYSGPLGTPLRVGFTFILPVLLVVNVPARFLVRPLDAQNWLLALYALFATVASLCASRWLFYRALASYRSASS